MAMAITAKYLAPTNTRGSRIKVSSWKGSTTHSWDHAMNASENFQRAMDEHIKAKCTIPAEDIYWKCLGYGEDHNDQRVAIIERTSQAHNWSVQDWYRVHFGA